MTALPITPGIYVITCTTNGKIYVGGTTNLRRRQSRHITDLNAGNHNNPLLQAAWKAFGRGAFKFAVLELCERAILVEREQYYLDTLQPFDARGFNIGRDVKRPALGRSWSAEQRAKITARNSKSYLVISPHGTQTHIVNLSKFCREHNLDHSSMSAVANGKTYQHKGWRCEHAPSTPAQFIKDTLMPQNDTLKLLISHDTDGVDLDVVRSLAERIVPALRALLQEEAHKIAEKHEMKNPFSEDAAMRLMLFDLAGFLTLTELDSHDDCVLPHQMTSKHVRFWLTPGGE